MTKKIDSVGRGLLGGRGLTSSGSLFFWGTQRSPSPPPDFSGEKTFHCCPISRSSTRLLAGTTGAHRSEALSVPLGARQGWGREPQHETAPATARPGVRPPKP